MKNKCKECNYFKICKTYEYDSKGFEEGFCFANPKIEKRSEDDPVCMFFHDGKIQHGYTQLIKQY